ncbi:MAG TPA: hypothetical protein VG992_00785 [Candidatus Saccharimonadales bacterium]|nr:hypothetical protein [Candidatus Saccharimonadales bacterium]
MKGHRKIQHAFLVKLVIVAAVALAAGGLWYSLAKTNAHTKNPRSLCNYSAFNRLPEESRNTGYKSTAQTRRWDNLATNLFVKLKAAKLPASDYGGMWLDSATGRVQVGLVGGTKTADQTKRVIQEKTDEAGLNGGTDIVPVKYSYATLNKSSYAIHVLIQKYIIWPEWPIQTGIKTDLNRVEVDVPADKVHLTAGHCRVLTEMREKYRGVVLIRTYDQIPHNN